jgi:hypothetical protein
MKLRVRASAAIAAAAVAICLMTVAAAPAHAVSLPAMMCGYIVNGSHYLDDYGGGSGTYVHTYPYTGSNNQTWCLEPADGNNNNPDSPMFIHPWNNLAGLCLDAHTGNNHQKIWVYTCNNTFAQLWNWAITFPTCPNGLPCTAANPSYLVRYTNSQLALHDSGLYNIVTIQNGGNNQWVFQFEFWG